MVEISTVLRSLFLILLPVVIDSQLLTQETVAQRATDWTVIQVYFRE